MIKRATVQRSLSALWIALSVLAINLTMILPIFDNVNAAPEGARTGINIPRNQVHNGTSMPLQTCEAYFETGFITQGLVEDHLLKNQLDDNGYEFEPAVGNNFDDFLLNLVGSNAPIIKFRALGPNDVSESNIANGVYNGRDRSAAERDTICANTILVPVATQQWVGIMFTDGEDGTPVDDAIMSFSMDGSEPDGGPNTYFDIVYWNAASCNNPNSIDGTLYHPTGEDACYDTSNNFVVRGKPSGFNVGGGPSTTLGLTARWVDAATIERDVPIPGSSGVPAYSQKETYRLNKWRVFQSYNNSLSPAREVGYTVYFLESSDNPARNNIAEGTGKSCSNPISTLDDEKHPTFNDCNPPAGGQQCTPFIVVTEQLNISTHDGRPNIDGPSENFNDRVNKMGSASAYFYDFNPDGCTYTGHSSGKTLGRQERSKAWFYYSQQNNAVVNVFATADGNEVPFIGTYNEYETVNNPADPSNNPTIRFQGGQSGCNARAHVRGSGILRNTTWDFWNNPNCQGMGNPIGSVQVSTIAGSEGEDGFTGVTGRAASIDVPESEALQSLTCSIGALDWLLCPVLRLATWAAEGLDAIINSLLDVDTNQIFGSEDTADDYHRAWGVFRTFALVLIVAAALVMVIAQAAGLELLDAYTIRKILPRLIIATIGITISWEILEFLVTLSNDLGHGIRSIIYAPFSDFDFSVGIAGILASWGIAGGAVVLGFVAFPVLLSLILTGVLGALIAVLLMVFREVLIIFLVIVSPLAIACAILPNTQKAWGLWRSTFIGMLLVFVIVSAMIALGRVFAVTSAGAGILLTDVIALISWFAPYFAIPWAFGAASTVVGRLTGIINNRSRGIFGALQKQRGESMSRRMKELRENSGAAYNPIARGVGGLLRRATPGSGGFNPFAGGRAQYRASQQSMAIQAAEESIKRDNGRAAYDDDATEIASTAQSRDDFLNKMVDEKGKTRQQALDSLGLFQQGFGVQMGSKQARLVAAKALAQSPTAFKPDDFETMVGKIARIDSQLINDGTMNSADAAAMWKGASSRPDIAKISFGEHEGMARHAAETVRGNGRATNSDLVPNVGSLENSFIDNADPSTMRLRPEAVQHYNDIMKKRIGTNVKAGTNESLGNLKKDLARLANMYDAFSQAGSSNTQILAEGVYNSTVPLQDKDGKTVDVTVQRAIEGLRGDETFQKLRREYRSELAAGANQGGEENK